MTLAFHGKSRRRQGILILLAVVTVMAAIGFGAIGTQRFDAKAQAVNVDLDQWANGDPPPTDAGWQNGNLNGNNSQYAEGLVVPFRLVLEGLTPGSEYQIHLNYDFTAGGHKGYDYLTTFNVTESPDPCGVGGGALYSGCPVALPSAVSIPFQSDPFDGDPGAAVLPVSGTQGAPGNLLAFGVSAGSTAVPTHDGPLSGNSSGDIVVTFTASAPDALFLWGGHLALSTYWDGAIPNGASQISGAPWHMRTQNLYDVTADKDAGGKNQDRSIQPSALQAVGSLTVTKQVTGDGAPAQLFQICLAGPDDPAATISCETLSAGGSFTWLDLVPGDYYVTETDPGSDWVVTISPPNPIAVAGDANVSVTVTNRPAAGRVNVTKQVVNVAGDATPFDISISAPVTNFTVTDENTSAYYPIAGGNQTITEAAEPGYTTLGWARIFPGDGRVCPTTMPTSTGSVVQSFGPGNVININVADNNTYEVCFYNELATGTVVVQKVDLVPGTDEWNFSMTGPGVAGVATIVDSGTQSFLEMPLGSYTVTEDEAALQEACPDPNPEGVGYYTTVSTPDGTSLVEAGDEITFIFTNQPCPVVLATGNLRIEKWNDLNGNGVRDVGEPAIANWPVTVSGPEFPGGQGFTTNASGVISLDGITTGFYTVTEGLPGGWYQTGLIVNTVSQPVSATAVVEVGESPAGQPRVETLVEFGNRELAEVIVIKTVTDLVGIPPRGVGGWHINLAGCGTSINKVTDASGTAVFSNLLPADNCAYTVTETDTEGFTVTYTPGQVVTPGPGQTATVNVKNTRVPGETPTPPPPTPTATSTPVTPTATPTETPTEEPAPTETVAGEKTPGVLATPIAPEAGTGFRGGGSAGSIGLALLGLAAVTGSMLLLSLGRKRS